MSRQSAIARATAALDDGRFLNELSRRIAIRSESQVPERASDLLAYLNTEIMPTLQRLGFTVSIVDNPLGRREPFLLAERFEDAVRPTVLSYAHGDVQRGQDELWQNGRSPWVARLEGDRIFGRGTGDNKGQHTINLLALEAVLAERGRLGFNLRWLFECGEETGSPGLWEVALDHRSRLAADVLIASDGPRLEADQPTIFLGNRGSFTFRLTAHLRDQDLHSGNWGGIAPNAATVLANAIASLVSGRGRILNRAWAAAEVPDSVRRALAGVMPAGQHGPTPDPTWGEPGLTAAEKIFFGSTVEVLALKAGQVDQPVNAIPGHAEAVCQVRFGPMIRGDALMLSLREHLDSHGYGMVQAEPTRGSFYGATSTDPDHPWVRWVTASVRRSLGRAPVLLPGIGGTLPNEVFTNLLGLPTIYIPHSYPGCGQHAPNEHLLLPIAREALSAMAGIWWDLGDSDLTPSRARPIARVDAGIP